MDQKPITMAEAIVAPSTGSLPDCAAPHALPTPSPQDPQPLTLLALASRVAAASVDLEELALHVDFLPPAARDIVLRTMEDTRLRRLERLLASEVHGLSLAPYENELQREWRRRCRLAGLHVDVVVSSETLFRDTATGASRPPRDARCVFWEHHFRSVLRADAAARPPDLTLYADVVGTLKVNARELVPRNVAYMLALTRLRRVELHHPTDHHKDTVALGLERLLAQAPALHELGVFHGRLAADLLQRVADALTKRAQRRDKPVQCLEFVSVKLKTQLDHDALVALFAAADGTRPLARVRISSVVADFENRGLVDALLALPHLTHLSLEHNDLEDAAFTALARRDRDRPIALRQLRLGNNAISAVTMDALCHATRDGTLALERLELRNNQHLGDAGIDALTPIFTASNTATLTHLDVRNCHVGLDGARLLFTALRDNATLTSLDVSQNFFGSSVGDLVAECLLTNTTLQRLHVNYVGLGLAGCTERLLLALRTNFVLRVLSVGANRLRDQGAVLLAQAIAVRSRVVPYEALDLSGNLITADGLHELRRVLAHAPITSQQSDEYEEEDEHELEPLAKRQRILVDTGDTVDTDDAEPHSRSSLHLIGQLGLLNNDLQGRGDAAVCTRAALDALRQFVGKVHSNEWSGRRNVYDDEV